MTPEHHDPDHDDAHVTLLDASAAAERRQYLASDTPGADRGWRTDAQRHADTAWDKAEANLDTVATALADNIRWAQSLGVSIPRAVLDIKSVLSEYRAMLADERASRG